MPGVREVNRGAFGREVEARLADELRDGGHARLSLVAEEGGRLVGAVPGRQGRGLGSALIGEGLDRRAHAGHRIVVLLGHPDYYPRFGFSAERAGNLSCAYSGEAFMALDLVPGALSKVAGKFEFAPPFEAAS